MVLTPFFIGGSVIGATNTVLRSFCGQAMLCSFCTPETQHFQKNSFSFFNQKSRNRPLKLGNQKYANFLDQLINYVSLIIPIKLRLLHRGFRHFW